MNHNRKVQAHGPLIDLYAIYTHRMQTHFENGQKKNNNIKTLCKLKFNGNGGVFISKRENAASIISHRVNWPFMQHTKHTHADI